MDSSIRFIYTGNLSHTKPQLEQTGGFLEMIKARHSTYVATHQQLYTYFKSDVNKLKHTGQQISHFAICQELLKEVFISVEGKAHLADSKSGYVTLQPRLRHTFSSGVLVRNYILLVFVALRKLPSFLV